jgi:hypothetical protein
VNDLRGSDPVLADRAYVADGPMGGPLGAWATLLPLAERLWRDPAGVRVDRYRESAPALVKLAERIVADGTLAGFMSMDQPEAMALLWDDLVTAMAADQRLSAGAFRP